MICTSLKEYMIDAARARGLELDPDRLTAADWPTAVMIEQEYRRYCESTGATYAIE